MTIGFDDFRKEITIFCDTEKEYKLFEELLEASTDIWNYHMDLIEGEPEKNDKRN